MIEVGYQTLVPINAELQEGKEIFVQFFSPLVNSIRLSLKNEVSQVFLENESRRRVVGDKGLIFGLHFLFVYLFVLVSELSQFL